MWLKCGKAKYLRRIVRLQQPTAILTDNAEVIPIMEMLKSSKIG